jgi:hypothetical protein
MFHNRLSQPRDGHELIALEAERGIYWCLRCGALWLDARPDLRATPCWEAPGQAGCSRSTKAAPPCLWTSDDCVDVARDRRLMLHALTHGWRCTPVLLHREQRTEAWRWAREGPLGGEAWSVAGAWNDGPVIDDTVRRSLLITTA